MTISFIPPPDPPLSIKYFTDIRCRRKTKFDPGPINFMIRKHAAGIPDKPTAEQLRDWMNDESPIPDKYQYALHDTIAKMRGHHMIEFRQNCGSSIRGFVHLIHQVGATNDKVSHYVDHWSDIGDPRPRWDRGYACIEYGF